MAEQAGVAQVDIVGNTAPLDASLSDAQKRTQQAVAAISRAFNEAAKGQSAVTRSTQQLEQRMQRLAQSARDGHTAFTRVRAATQLATMQFDLAQRAGLSFSQTLGAMSGSINLLSSVIIGSLVAQALAALGRSLIQATTQFASLQNEMATITRLSGNVGQEFKFVERVARDSNVSLRDLSKSYSEVSKQAHEAGLEQEFVRKTFEDYNKALKERQVETIGSSTGKLLEAIGGTIAGLDRATAVSNIIVAAFNGVRFVLEKINSLLPQGRTQLESWQNHLTTIRREMERYQTVLDNPNSVTSRRVTAEREIATLRKEDAKTVAKIQELTKEIYSPEVTGRYTSALKDLNKELEHEASLLGLSNSEQGVRNRLFQTELQFRNLGRALTAEDRAGLEVQLRQTQLIQDATEAQRAYLGVWMDRVTGERLLTDEMNFMATNHAEIVEQAQARIRLAYGETLQAQLMMADVRRQLALQEQNQMLGTATAAANAIQALWPKEKAAAIAAATINTGVAVTKALTSGIPPWNIATAALVGAAGLAQIAAIRSTNLGGGGTIPSVSGGGGSTPAAAPEQAAPSNPGRAVNIYVPKGEFFSSDTMMKFIARLNEEVANGAIMISTRTVAT